MPTVTIAGGTGLIGTALSKALVDNGYDVIVLTRSIPSKKNQPRISYMQWEPEKRVIDKSAISTADYIINLAGAGIADKRWTKERKKEIAGSRIRAGELISQCLEKFPNKIKAVINGSAIGWYGPDRDGKPFEETDPPAKDFLGETCRLWESSVDNLNGNGIRVVKLRTGIVLSRKGGALQEFLKPMRFGIATVMGNGKQVVSWIHIEDLVELYLFTLRNENMHGVYNAVAPHPVSNRELIKAIAGIKKGFKIIVKIPALFLKIILGKMAVEVLKSCRVSSLKTKTAGFEFRFNNIDAATKNLMEH